MRREHWIIEKMFNMELAEKGIFATHYINQKGKEISHVVKFNTDRNSRYFFQIEVPSDFFEVSEAQSILSAPTIFVPNHKYNALSDFILNICPTIIQAMGK